jgi:hypothetical protein
MSVSLSDFTKLKNIVLNLFSRVKTLETSSGSSALPVGGTYSSETDAAAALGTGKLYKSATLINGAPIILITAGSNAAIAGVYDTNAAAVAALGTGNLYKSSTLMNGSPIILITV